MAASLEAMGHTVVRLQEDQTPWGACVAATTDAQMFLWTKTWSIDEEGGHLALAEIRRMGVPSASFHLDRYVGLDREEQITHDPFWRTDAVFTADGGSQEAFRAYRVNHHWLPPAVYDAECGIGRPNRRRFPHRVVFVGSVPYPHAEWAPYRAELLDRLTGHLGDDFGVWPQRRQPIRGQALADLYATADVVIGDSCLVGQPARYWSDRIPETLGRGGFLIHPEVEGLEEWYRDGDHLVTYPVGDFDAMLALVDEYLDDAEMRQAIGHEGQAIVLGRDTYRHRMASVIETLGAEFGIPAARPSASVATVRAARDRPQPRQRGADARQSGAHRANPARPNRMTVAGRAALERPDLLTVRHPRSRQPARFELAQGDTDATAVREVWTDDTYGLLQAHVTGRHVLDIGANVGAFSVLAARMGAARVHAYEPHPASYQALVANVSRNAVLGVQTHQRAVLGQAGEVVLVGAGGGAHVGGDGDGHKVEAVGINEAIDAAAGPDGRVGFLKVDCEGGEYDIFAGMDPERLARVDRIAMEWHGPLMGPHLTHLGHDGRFLSRWQDMIVLLADHGRLSTVGHPSVGGILTFQHY